MTSRAIKSSFLLFVGALLALPARAALVVSDFATAGDGMLVTDTATSIQWLAPRYTSNQSYNTVAGGYLGLVTTQGFQFASRAQVLNMLTTNFSTLPIDAAGTAAGYSAAQAFFGVFGINENTSCPGATPPGPCPRTQGITADVASAGSHRVVGVITLGSGGSAIGYGFSNNLGDSLTDQQFGSWLIRSATATVPEPGTLVLSGLGLIGIAFLRRRPRGSRNGLADGQQVRT
jgi:hypothetical protein